MEEQKPLSELAAAAMQRVPQVLQNATFASRKSLESMTKMQACVRDAERDLADRGRILVRWSGTEAKLRVMVEGEDESVISALALAILDAAHEDMA